MIDKSYITWSEFISFANGFNFTNSGCHPDHYGLTVGGRLPHSINEYEFNYMRDYIIKNNLKCGYELATGIGVSTVGIGLGFKKTGGKVITLDSYVEEQNQEVVDNRYDINSNIQNGGKSRNKSLMQRFSLDDTVILEQGWSPTDSIKFIDRHFQGKKLDFVFLDCPKYPDEYERDASYLINYVDKSKFCIFVHDTHTMRGEFIQLSEKYFGITPKFINKYNFGGRDIEVRFPIALITNIP